MDWNAWLGLGAFGKKSRKLSKSPKPAKPKKPKPTGFATMPAASLKDLCKMNNLPVSGKKEDLVKRLTDAGLDPNAVRNSADREAFEKFFGAETLKEHKYIGASAPYWEDFSPSDTAVTLDCFTNGQQNALHKIQKLFQSDADRAVFDESGVIPMVPEIQIKSTGQVLKTWPLEDAEAEQLVKAGTDAPFGRGTETVMDKNVRSCIQITPDDMDIRTAEWNKIFSDSTQSPKLEAIRKKLAPNTTKISAQFYKMLIYRKGDFFAPHVDTLRDPNMFATLVVELPGDYFGGALSVKHSLGRTVSLKGGRDWWSSTWESASEWQRSKPAKKTQCKYLAFYTDCSHQIDKVQKGYRITLVYNLLRSGEPVPGIKDPTFSEEVVEAYRKLFAGPPPKLRRADDEGPHFDRLAVVQILQHTYGLTAAKPKLLKGKDAEYYQALVDSGEFDVLLLPVGIEQSGVAGCGDERSKHYAPSLISEAEEVLQETYPIDTSAPTKPSGGDLFYPTFSKTPFEEMGVYVISAAGQFGKTAGKDISPSGNEGTGAALLYVNVALCVKKKDPQNPFVPPTDKAPTPTKAKKASAKRKREEEHESDESDEEGVSGGAQKSSSSSAAAAAGRPARASRGKKASSPDMIPTGDDDDDEDESDEEAGGTEPSPAKRRKTEGNDDEEYDE